MALRILLAVLGSTFSFVSRTRDSFRRQLSRDVVIEITPGIFQPRRRLDRAMVAAAWDGTAHADVSEHPDACAVHAVGFNMV